MNIDYENIERDLSDGTLRQHLEEELIAGFRQIQQTGERLPLVSHYAAQIAEIINRNATLTSAMQFELYQEVLEAVESARTKVLAEEPGAN